MSSLTIYFLRHGQTGSSRDSIYCGSGSNIDMTPAGEEMARQFAAAYSGFKFDAIYASPMKRTQATAAPIAQAQGLTPELRDGLREIGYGSWEGLTVPQVQEKFHDDYIKWTADPGWNAPTGGETAQQIAERGVEVVEEIRSKFKSGNVLVVCHKATIRIIICSLLGIDVGRYRYRLACPVCSLNVVEFGKEGPMVKRLADVSHLSVELRSLEGS